MSEGFDTVLRLAQVRDGDRLDLAAGEAERAAIVERIGLVSLDSLKAHAAVHRDGDRIRLEGRLQAVCAQACVATGEPVPAHVDEAFDLFFLPAPSGSGGGDEIELDADEMDVVFHDGAAVAVGDALVDTLSLALDPYPRSPGAEAVLKDAGVLSEEEMSPFAALAALKGKLSGD